METKQKSLLVLDFQNLWRTMGKKLPLAEVRNKIEAKQHAHVSMATIFLAQYFVAERGSVWERKLYEDAERFGFEVRVVPRPSVCQEMDFVDIAIMDYCRQKAPEIKSLIIGTGDGDFKPIFIDLRARGIEVSLAYYDMPSINLLRVASHHFQLKAGCMCQNRKRFLSGR